MRESVSCGQRLASASDLKVNLGVSRDTGFHFVVVDLVHPALNEHTACDESVELSRSFGFTWPDLCLPSRSWSTYVVAEIRVANLESHDDRVRICAEKRLTKDFHYATHLGLPAVVVALRMDRANSNLARCLHTFLTGHTFPLVWCRLPMTATRVLSDASEDSVDPWVTWDSFRTQADHHKCLELTLELNEAPTQSQVDRWMGEPVKAIFISTKVFLTNKRGYPVLPRAFQSVLKQFVLQLDVQFVLEGHDRNHDLKHYLAYLDNFYQQTINSPDNRGLQIQRYVEGFEDRLQSPLQPLMDNLDSNTYEVFESDPVKYREYQRAIVETLKDRVKDEEKESTLVTIMVLGAGRGPLVRASLEAAKIAERQIRVFAVEKNPNAIVTLLTQKQEQWGDKVQVITKDMRRWNPSHDEKADIAVSELLGSFGDNELSPECLYSAQHLFKPDCISIPASYTSWVAPLQSSKLYNEARDSTDLGQSSKQNNLETPYVVHMQNKTLLAEPKPLFTFQHPLPKEEIQLNRHGRLSFEVTMDCRLHGLGGFFDCVLYKDVTLSIHPKTHSEGMISWFPIFFPLRNPMRLRPGEILDVLFWRMNNEKHVWYEWGVGAPNPCQVHNLKGRAYTIGL